MNEEQKIASRVNDEDKAQEDKSNSSIPSNHIFFTKTSQPYKNIYDPQ